MHCNSFLIFCEQFPFDHEDICNTEESVLVCSESRELLKYSTLIKFVFIVFPSMDISYD